MLPVVIWLAARGALRAAWYGAIVHNMRYTETGSTGRVAMLLHSRYGLAAMLMAALACLGALALRKKSPMLALGMVAAAAAFFLEWGLYDFVLTKIQQLDTLKLFVLTPFTDVIEIVAIAYALTGFLVGVFGSLLSIRKFLKV